MNTPETTPLQSPTTDHYDKASKFNGVNGHGYTGDTPAILLKADPEGSLIQLNNHLDECPHLRLRPSNLQDVAGKMAQMVVELRRLGCPPETAEQLSLLTVYDLVILLDDSYSMQKEERGERINVLKKVLRAICEVYQLARPEGITVVEFLNNYAGADDVTSDLIDDLLNIKWHGITPLGTVLKEKILDDLIFHRDADLGPIEKPVIILTITDGGIEGEDPVTLEHNVITAVEKLMDHETMGKHDVGFMFAKVGNDPAAHDLLHRLDNDHKVGEHIDCFVNGDLSKIDSNKPLNVKWSILRKLLLGAIMKDVDEWENNPELGEGAKTAKLAEERSRKRERIKFQRSGDSQRKTTESQATPEKKAETQLPPATERPKKGLPGER